VYYKTIGSEPNRKFVVEWYDSIVSNNSDSNITFEVILEEQTNDIIFQYMDMSTEWLHNPAYYKGKSATIGIENSDGSIGTQYSYNQDSISDNVAIRLSTVAVEPLQEEIIVVPFLMESSDSISVTVLPEDVSPGARITGINYDITPKPDWFWYQWDIGMYHWAYPGDFLESIYPDASYNGLAFSGIIYDFNGEEPFGTWELDLGHDWNTYMSSASLLIHYAYPANPTFPDDLDFGYEKQGEFCDPGMVGNPVSVYNGNKYELHTDLNFPTPHGNKLTFSRFYNSRSNELGILGFGWTNSYSVSLQTNVQINGSSYLKITDYSGKGVYFIAEDATNWKGTFHEKSAIRYDDTFYIWEKIDGSRYGFTDQGRLAWIEDTIGNRQVMTYDGNERLQSVIDQANGRVLTFNYNIDNLLSTISGPITPSVPDGIWMTLGYDLNDNLTTATYADGSGYVYEYNDPNDIHNLTAKKNILNHMISSWSYDDSDRALTSTTRDGKGVTIDYTDPNSVLVTDAYGVARTYAVSLHGAKKKVDDIVDSGGYTSCSGDEPIRYEYDENLNVIEIEYANTRIDQYENFDDRGNPGTVIRAFGTPEQKTISFTYHQKVNQPLSETKASILDPGNKETIWDYDDPNNGDDNPAIPNEKPTQRVWKIIERGFTRDNSIIIAYEDVTTFSYNAKGQMTLMDGPLSGDQDETLFDYDPVTGDILSVTMPLVGTTTFSNHDGAGNPGSITDINNQTTSYTYDGRNRVTDISQNGRTTKINFTLAGDIETITDPEQRTLTYSYDTTYGRLVQITDPLNNYLFYDYNAWGYLVENSAFDATDTKQRWQRYDYYPDPAYPDQPSGKLWKTINFNNSEIEYQYNAMGSVVSVTDEMNKTTTYEYDPLNRLSKTIQPGPDTPETIYAYDSHGNLIQVTDAETHTTTYLYDDRGNLLETDSPDTGITTYEYDSIGRLSSKTDAKDITIQYSYDSLNRLTQIDYPTDPDVTFAFDQDSNGMGRLSSMADSITSYAYKYDAFGNMIQVTATIGGHTYSTGYGYDLADNLVSLTHQSGRRITYQRGADGRITDVVTQRNGQDYYLAQNISYLPFGPQQSLTFGNVLNLTKGFNQGYGITSIITGAIENLSYTPNLDTSIVSITNNLDPTRDQDFGYDDLNRLETADGLYGNILFDYDLTGNRQTMTNGAESDAYAYLLNTNMLDTITGTHPAAFSYDANGNIEAKGDLTFVYNENNRIKEAYDTGALAGEYLYNASNQQVKKIADSNTTIYIYDIFGNLIQEIPDNGSPTQDYVYLNGERLARIEYINRNQCESDFDWTGAVDGTDLATMVSEFGSTACYSTPCQSDIDNNGEVNNLDLIAFANAYGQTNCPLEPESVYYFHNDHRAAPLKRNDFIPKLA
ncbi:MAG: DUF6531 domain-containing protein, partial [Thermodesulfobacteriota bacterium]|nr:DUF6531 domain-containing protein [Thermodesulfobacteriota bacterium]